MLSRYLQAAALAALTSGCEPAPIVKPAAQPPAPPATRSFTLGEPGVALWRVDGGRGLRAVEDVRDVPPRWQGAVIIEFPEHKESAGYYIADLFDAQPGERRVAHRSSARALNRLGEDLVFAIEQSEQIAFSATSIVERLEQLAEERAIARSDRRSRTRTRSSKAAGGGGGGGGGGAGGLIIESLGGRADEPGEPQLARGPSSSAAEGGGKATRPPDHAKQLSDVVASTNSARAQEQNCGLHGMRPPVASVSRNAKLDRAAQDYAELMARRAHFGHTGPDGSTPSTRAAAAGYKAGAGENIAAGYRSARAAVAGWIESDGHCQNLMGARYLSIGVGMADGADGKRYWVQMFGVEP